MAFANLGLGKTTATSCCQSDWSGTEYVRTAGLNVDVSGWGVEEASGKEFWIIENSFGKDRGAEWMLVIRCYKFLLYSVPSSRPKGLPGVELSS